MKKSTFAASIDTMSANSERSYPWFLTGMCRLIVGLGAALALITVSHASGVLYTFEDDVQQWVGSWEESAVTWSGNGGSSLDKGMGAGLGSGLGSGSGAGAGAGTNGLGSTISWNWDSGTTEGWTGTLREFPSGYEHINAQLSIETGTNGTFGLGAIQWHLNASSGHPVMEISGQTLNPSDLVEGITGEQLPMVGEITVDTNRSLEGHANYLDLEIFHSTYTGRFLSYPHDNIGTIEDLGTGWYRHHLGNLRNFIQHVGPEESRPAPPGTIRLAWNYSSDARVNPIVFDNLSITYESSPIPEPTPVTLACVGLGIWIMLSRRRA